MFTAGAHARGVALCVLSACAFGAMAIFAKQAYAAGFAVADLLSLRLVAAAGCLWALALATGRSPLGLSRRTALTGFALGAVLFAAQAQLFFGSLERIDASLSALLLYTYPALVLVAALALGRERATRRRLVALALAGAGTILVLAGGGAGAADTAGIAMALGAAVSYSAYLLVSESVLDGADPLALATIILSGAAVSLTAAALASGGPDLLSVDATGYVHLAAIVAISTVGGVLALFAGLRLVGASTASILSTAEPVVTVLLAAAVFGEALGPWQAAGGALVLSAVVVLQRRVASGGDVASAPAPGPAAARTPAHQPA